MADSEKTAMLLDELAALDPMQRREVATELRKVSETFVEVPDGRHTAHTGAGNPLP
jgi:ABC-type polar amino acid transport system ATPase subunit